MGDIYYDVPGTSHGIKAFSVYFNVLSDRKGAATDSRKSDSRNEQTVGD